ncbi:hypothetical protein [Pseudonocardia phyllosphaerae]|uniref:hypothetical protein n=1 Tax=Pseudonocardia phyllosphaerae TaxID=3390502 RepID=UPI00397DECD2
MSRSGVVLRTLAWCVAVLAAGGALLGALVFGLGSLVHPEPAHSEPPPDTATAEFRTLAATDPVAALRQCPAARPTDFDALAASLRAGVRPAPQRYAVTDGALTYITAPVRGAGTSGDAAVWVWGGQGFAAVTDDARLLSPRLPGPQLYRIGPDAPGAVRAAACTEAALRVTTGAPGVAGPTVPVATPPAPVD